MDKFGDDESSVCLSRVPVFVFPSAVVFNAQERDHLKQILTIYNPYEFPIRFKVLSTSPSHYTVVDPEGSIKSKHSVDLILRLTSNVPSEAINSLEDKFRVQIFNYHTKQSIGRKDIPSTIFFSQSGPATGFSDTKSLSGLTDFQQLGPQNLPERDPSVFLAHRPNYVAVATAFVCILGLLLPVSEIPGPSVVPVWLHLTVNQKLLVAYTLGLVTMVIFRP